MKLSLSLYFTGSTNNDYDSKPMISFLPVTDENISCTPGQQYIIILDCMFSTFGDAKADNCVTNISLHAL